MADVKGFKALRYAEDRFPKPPVAPPYDIISDTQREKIAEEEYNIIKIDKPGNKGDDAQYARARDLLDMWKKEGVLITEDAESIYVYQETYTIPESPITETFTRTGIFCVLKLEEFSKGVVLPHEKTLAAPKVDRMNLMKATKGNMSPIFGLYGDSGEVGSLIDTIVTSTPLYEQFVDTNGTTHTLWRVQDAQVIATMHSALADKKVIIADGHHRYETALNYRDHMLEMNASVVDTAKYIMMCLVDFADDGLVVLPTHRKVSFAMSSAELLDKLKDFFDVADAIRDDLITLANDLVPQETVLGLYCQDTKKCYTLTLKDDCDYEAFMPREASSLWKSLNVNVLSYMVFKEVMEMSDERFQEAVTYTHSAREAFDAVDTGESDFVFFLQSIDKFTIKSCVVIRPYRSRIIQHPLVQEIHLSENQCMTVCLLVVA
jgi:uncharacterized protein (DUF1015 family)